ncbi:hypothetical protein [Delftia sp. PS-11]|uniref:hypothetical protein n=1 Tax=Delftia sp. PS-11 TaxID=2767222 RepID=UPI0024552F5A|nr:hypothetical protein [Delftia sp. PS-11]KAJ8743675.1 hypothetical protein H9T68_15875 [Delftia sp. PS-11]
MSKIDLTAGTAVSMLLGSIASIALILIWCGFWVGLTLSTLWGWFVSPLFGLPVITLLQAYGLALVFRAAWGFDNKKREPESFGAFVARSLVQAPLAAGLTLGVGWVAKSWM